MALIYRGQFLNRPGFHVAIGGGGMNGFPCNDTFVDRGIQLSTIEGIPFKATDSSKWLIPWTSLPEETPVWQSRFPDAEPRRRGIEDVVMLVGPILPGPLPGWGVVFADPSPRPVAPPPQVVTPPRQLEAAWGVIFAEASPRPLAPPPVVVIPPRQLEAGWGATYAEPEQRRYVPPPVVVNPVVIRVYTGDQAVPIHVPDEVPPDRQITIQVEHDIGGGAVPFDAPPDLRVYHLDVAGNQVVDLPYGVCTQYGVNPSYFRNWTPTATGKYIVEVVGLFLGLTVVGTQTITVRNALDPIALADRDILVTRNGDIE